VRPRFSILNLLLMTTVVALAFGVCQLYVELRTEKALRRELLQKGGILQVFDPDVAHVVQVTTRYERNTRRWRVYVPPGRTATLNARLDPMPADKKPAPRLPPGAIVVAERAPSNPIELDAGEHVVSVYFDIDTDYFSMEAVGSGTRRQRLLRPFDGDVRWLRAGWAEDITYVEHTPTTLKDLAAAQTLKLNDGETFVLCRFRQPKWTAVLRPHRNNTQAAISDRVNPSDKVAEVLIWLHADDR
jgi:hypothetical protein